MEIDKKLAVEGIGLLAVVLTLIFLAVEVQQNSLLMRSQIRDSITGKQIDFYSIIGGSIETSEIIAKVLEGNDDVSRAEQQVFQHWASAALRMWENEWFQFQNGLFEEEEFVPRMQVWARLAPQPGFRTVWLSVKGWYSPDFQAQVNRVIDD